MKGICLEPKRKGFLSGVRVTTAPELVSNIKFIENVSIRVPSGDIEEIRRSIPFHLTEHLSAILFFTKEADEFRFRVAGSRFAGIVGAEASGKTFSDVLSRWPELHQAIEDCASSAFEGHIRSLSAFTSAGGLVPRHFEVVFLPLKGSDGRIVYGLGHVAFQSAS